ncbi:MAG: integrase [Alphaproteobacteria bacterium]|nr:MAG: integrase [Alphaproteobacteria bacterium]
MAVMLSKTYDALIAAGAPDDKARAAAEELAGYESRFVKIETDLAVLKWMVGVNLAASLSIVVKLFV